MFQLSLTVLLALSISANFVFMIEVFEADTTNLQKESTVGALKNNNQTVESPKSHEEPSKNVTNIDTTSGKDQQKVDTSHAKNSTTTSITKPIEKQQKPAKLSDEQAKMNPLDKDKKDVVTIETSKGNTTSASSTLGTTPSSIKTTLSSSNVDTTTSDDSSSSPHFHPAKALAHDLVNITGILNGPKYETFPPNLDHVTEEATTSKIASSTVVTTNTTNNDTTPVAVTTNSTPAAVTAKTTPATVTAKTTPATVTAKTTTVTAKTTPTTVTVKTTPAVENTTSATNASIVLSSNQTQNGNSKMTVKGVENLHQAELTEKNKESENESKNESMPPGVIALVTAITCAVAIAIGYISMVVWKQYLEHRYGRRELLVNELEFDTNDLRHFEL